MGGVLRVLGRVRRRPQMKRISSAELAQLASLPPLPVATGLTLTEQERHARELAAKALSMPSTVDGPGQPTASDGALDELCEWLRTEPALNEEVVQAARPKLRAEQVPLPAARRTMLSWLSCVTLVATRLPGLLGA